MELHVNGSLEKPIFVSEPLPGLNDALQQLSSELEPAGNRTDAPAPARGTAGSSVRRHGNRKQLKHHFGIVAAPQCSNPEWRLS